jgi:hypothetical protein
MPKSNYAFIASCGSFLMVRPQGERESIALMDQGKCIWSHSGTGNIRAELAHG